LSITRETSIAIGRTSDSQAGRAVFCKFFYGGQGKGRATRETRLERPRLMLAFARPRRRGRDENRLLAKVFRRGFCRGACGFAPCYGRGGFGFDNSGFACTIKPEGKRKWQFCIMAKSSMAQSWSLRLLWLFRGLEKLSADMRFAFRQISLWSGLKGAAARRFFFGKMPGEAKRFAVSRHIY